MMEESIKEKEWGLVITRNCYLYEKPGDVRGDNESEITDEIFSGWAVQISPKRTGEGWLSVETHYGYTGYVYAGQIRRVTREVLLRRQDSSRCFLVEAAAADVLAEPRVQGKLLETLVRGSILELLADERSVSLSSESEGWCRVRTAAGQEGYVHAHFLTARRDDDGYLLASGKEKKDYFHALAGRRLAEADEGELRESLVENAMRYMGAQYRWAGKSSLGLDCSGLTFMSYMQSGILLYRDAWIREAYPVKEITREQLKKGDLLFFEGHVAMYLGEGRFIHATGFAADACVRINSLNPADADYRADLPGKLLWYGSVFAGRVCTKTGEDVQAALARNREKENPDFSPVEQREAAWERLQTRLAAMEGNISLAYVDLTTGRRTFFREDAPHVAASVIKLYLMAAYFLSFERGELDPANLLEVPGAAKVPSCGVLRYLEDGKRLSLSDLLTLMIIVSDNTATNVLFDHFARTYGPDRLNEVIRRELGFTHTVFDRKMFDSARAAEGIENYTTAADTALLLERLYKGELISQAASERMLAVLKDQRLNGKIPFLLHTLDPALVIAHKTGEDTCTTHDVAIIGGERPFVFCVLGNDVDVPALEREMARGAYELYRAV